MRKLTRNGLTHQVSCNTWSNPRIKIHKSFLKVSLLVSIKKMLIEIVTFLRQFQLDHGMFPHLVFLSNYFNISWHSLKIGTLFQVLIQGRIQKCPKKWVKIFCFLEYLACFFSCSMHFEILPFALLPTALWIYLFSTIHQVRMTLH